MKIESHTLPRTTIEQFADEHDLTMEIHERAGWPSGGRYYAHFKQVEVMQDGGLLGEFGNGETPEKAIRAYARALSGKRLAIGAFTPERKNVGPFIFVDETGAELAP